MVCSTNIKIAVDLTRVIYQFFMLDAECVQIFLLSFGS